ncbi:hypothetical protein G7074_03050 [Pedobacter sp. HDW13]|uniref:alpha-L-fucosidase n=1 Tax=Pedobacter sp. HDW13 TaxID=2714940 RepID=UPI00140BA3E8|nr:alpha-L-fucosidase [Pedobacter sp. HDW13]QIL38346.1 hypothetical protein G7074_03050 [Pedobacter sp. HDW13]
MRIKVTITMVFFFLGNVILAQEKPADIAKKRDLIAIEEAKNGWWKEAMASHQERMRWWREGKFGMFVHWGIYALPANDWKDRSLGGYSEHLMRREKITKAEYLKIAEGFNPTNFDADKWIKTARDAGMRYFVITAKHHDGFAMYPSAVSQFTLGKTTEFKRDPMAELSSACRRYGVKFGFYYSHAFDWEHPDAPGNDWEFNNPGGDKNLYGGRRWYDEHPELVAKAAKYVDEKAIPQLNELIDKYHPDILWFDTPHKLPYSENLRILKAIWIKDKNIVVNGRITDSWPYGEWGDYKSTDDQPVEFSSKGADWEGIPTTNDSYGYSRADKNYKSVSFFVRLLIKAASRGGNLLMNIGPKGDGTIDAPDKNILGGIGKWMSKNGESIYGTGASGLPLQNWG